jgi:hypothetical protein
VSTHPEGEKRYIFLADRTHIEGLCILPAFKGIDELPEDGTVIANREGLGG